MSQSLTTINPFTEEVIQEFPLMSDAEVEQAIQASQRAFEEWRQVPLEERATKIRSIGGLLQRNKEAFAQLMTREMGKLLKDARDEIDLCTAICEYTADNGPEALARETRQFGEGQTGYVCYSPVGVIYGIQPWNFPAYQVVRYAIANLMAGNSVLLKHAESVTGSGLFFERLLSQVDLPENLFQALIISHDQSNAVIANPLVRGVTLTGSGAAGKKVAALAGEYLKKTVLELGSNDAYLVLEDADVDLAVEQCVAGRIYNNGQTCINAKRFVVVDSIYEQFKEKIVNKMAGLTLGDPADDATQIGPMSRKELRDNLHDQVMQSVTKGAVVLCGGEIPQRDGVFYPATLLENVVPGQPAYDDELFGPVASLIRAKDDEDAMHIANDSHFGLGGGIFSYNRDRALALAEQHFDTGMVFINGFGMATPEMPFGGVKESGYGREHGGFGMKEFVNVKAVMDMQS